MTDKPQPFSLSVPQAQLADLRARLLNTRWPADLGNDDWRYGVNRDYLQDLVAYWVDGYDWRAQEAAINALPHYKVEIDGLPIHFVHVRGKGPAPRPLILTHGWPSTFWDLRKMIGPLADPAAYGGDPEDAFDVVIPSLPGFAFSSPLPRVGIDAFKTADVWVTLMRDVLGYDRFGAQGQDWGATVTQQLGHKYPQFLTGIHLSRYQNPFANDAGTMGSAAVKPEDFSPEEAGWYERNKEGLRRASHIAVHGVNPQTLAYAMQDSPAGMAAWLLEKRRLDPDLGDVENVFSRDDQITNVMLHWLTDTFVSSVRFYFEYARSPKIAAHDRRPQVETPTAIGVLPRDAIASPRKWAEAGCDLQQWTVYTSGGHYGVYQVYDQYVDDLRTFFRGRS
jgi:pimeloyl-ACP methyl ester carboxylesterase